jgi:hypothetical protein
MLITDRVLLLQIVPTQVLTTHLQLSADKGCQLYVHSKNKQINYEAA